MTDQLTIFQEVTPTLKLNVPEVITKNISLGKTSDDKRKLVLSSNFLRLYGFDKSTRVEYTTHEKGGLTVTHNKRGSHKVYERSYSNRKNNPLEVQLDIRNQNLLNEAFSKYTERVHVTISNGMVNFQPCPNTSWTILNRVRKDPYHSLVAMSSGIDMHSISRSGFEIEGLIEYRPKEARDLTDLSETGTMTAMELAKPRFIMNEDITTLSQQRLASMIQKPISLFHISLQCDDFSNIKAKPLKQRSLSNLTTSMDYVYDCLRIVETSQPACFMLENVPGFITSEMGQLLITKLKRWGYHVEANILNANEYGGRSIRKRLYIVASIFPGYQFPSANIATSNQDIWETIKPHFKDCRDVSNTKTLQDGLATGRARIITKDSSFSPTVLKSQNRQAKDSIFIFHNNKYLFPNETILKAIQGFPDDIQLNSVSSTIASEIIGQSIDYPMHDTIVKSIKSHLQRWL